MLQSYVGRAAHRQRAPARLGPVTELGVQRPHGQVPLFAAGDEPLEAGALRRGDLRPLERGGDATSAPCAPNGSQSVVTVAAVVVHRDIPDRLAVRDRHEQQVAPPRRPIELDRAPLLEAHVARIARNVGRGFDADRVQRFRELRTVGEGDDLDSRRHLRRLRFERREIERDGLLSAHDAVAATLEVLLRLDVALDDLALELRPTGLQCSAPELREQRRADAAPPESGDDHEMRRCKLVGPRIDEAAARGLSVESRDDVDERLVGGEVVPQILEPRRWPVGIGRDAHGDHHLEVGVGLRAHDREAGNSLSHGELL